MPNVTIEKLVYEGPGLGRLDDGQVVLVPFSVPGDTLTVLPDSKKPFAKIETIIESSSNRKPAECSVFGQCGGCHWQHIDYQTQSHAKQNIVYETLERVGKMKQPPVAPIITSDAVFEYRNHVIWHWNGTQLGYYRYHSNEIIPFAQCRLIPDNITHIYKTLVELLPQSINALDIDVKWSTSGEVLLTVVGKPQPEQAFIATILNRHKNITGICYQPSPNKIEILFGKSTISETLNNYTFQISAGSFFQVNIPTVQKLLDTLNTWITPADALLDAYAGVGLFSIALQKQFSKITAVESSPTAANDAKQNVDSNYIHNVDYHQQDVELFLNSAKQHWHTGIIDPPRGGCSPMVLNQLNDKITHSIIYISCNPTTLARDLKHLMTSGNWKVETVQPFDFFPQTYHIETAVLLRRL